jgi:hypothetical protein
MTEADLAQLEREHGRGYPDFRSPNTYHCRCGGPWPCVVDRLIAEVWAWQARASWHGHERYGCACGEATE